MLFGPVIYTDLQLICTLQITANQSVPTFEKHCETRANHCKSLQITSLENHRKNNADLQPPAVLDLVSKLGGRKAHFCRKLAVLILQLACAHSQTCHVVNCLLLAAAAAAAATAAAAASCCCFCCCCCRSQNGPKINERSSQNKFRKTVRPKPAT